MAVINFIKNIVKDKRVAFVGRSPVIVGKKLGKEIDGFDVVVRTNYFPIPEEYRADYGERCDVLMLHTWFTQCKYDVKNILHYRKIKEKMTGINYCHITADDRMRVSEEVRKVVGADPNKGTQGTNMMYFCIKGMCKEFKFFGVTGYQNNEGEPVDDYKMNNVSENWEKPANVYIKPKKNNITQSKSHNHKVLNEYTRHMLRIGAISMDEYSLEYFN
jgi:hypothetical protein